MAMQVGQQAPAAPPPGQFGSFAQQYNPSVSGMSTLQNALNPNALRGTMMAPGQNVNPYSPTFGSWSGTGAAPLLPPTGGAGVATPPSTTQRPLGENTSNPYALAQNRGASPLANSQLATSASNQTASSKPIKFNGMTSTQSTYLTNLQKTNPGLYNLFLQFFNGKQ